MSRESNPPKMYQTFIQRYPKLGEAWEATAAAGRQGNLDDKTQRLVKLAVAIAVQSEGAVHASVRKARDLGISREDMEQVIALASSTIGLPATVAAFSWVQNELPGSAQ